MEQKNRTALHEAARFVGFSLYVGADKIGMLSGLDVTDTPDTAPAPAGKIAIPNPALAIGKIELCSLAADYIQSGEADSLSWLEDATDGSPEWHGITAQTMHPVFQVVVSDLRASWSSVQVIANALTLHGSVAGKDLQPLARLAGLIHSGTPPPSPQPTRQDKRAAAPPWYRAAIDRYFSLKNLISWFK